MFHNREGWQEITSSDGTIMTYMAIFTLKGPDNWPKVASYFPKVRKVIQQFKLGGVAHVSVSAGVLTVSFSTDAGGPLPDVFTRAGRELTALLTENNS